MTDKTLRKDDAAPTCQHNHAPHLCRACAEGRCQHEKPTVKGCAASIADDVLDEAWQIESASA